MPMDRREHDKSLAVLHAQIDEALKELDAGCELNLGSKIIEEMDNKQNDFLSRVYIDQGLAIAEAQVAAGLPLIPADEVMRKLDQRIERARREDT